MRYLTKYEQLEKNYRYFLLLATLEEAGDVITLLASHISKKDDVASIAKYVKIYIHAMMKQDYTQVFVVLRKAKTELGEKTYVDGLTRSFYECLYNFSGYLIE